MSEVANKLGGLAAGVFGVVAIARFFTGGAEIEVRCASAESTDGIECTVSHTDGSAQVRACWRVEVDCANGVKPNAGACLEIGEGEQSEHLFPESDFANLDGCDEATALHVRDIKIHNL